MTTGLHLSQNEINLNELPEDVTHLLAPNTPCLQNEIGESAASVYRVALRPGSYAYLKIAPQHKNSLRLDSLKAEYERLKWLRPFVPVPEALHFVSVNAIEYLITSEVPGFGAHDERFKSQPAQVVRLLADSLRTLHSLDIASCPFDSSLNAKLRSAQLNYEHGLVDPSNFHAEHHGWSVADVYSKLQATPRPEEDLVVTHGDYCLPNVILSEDASEVRGFIDLGSLGVADRHQDLALCARSIGRNLGKEYVSLFFERYGIATPDSEKLAYYTLCDEFF